MTKKDLVDRVVNEIWEDRHEQRHYIQDLIEQAVMQWPPYELEEYLGIESEGVN